MLFRSEGKRWGVAGGGTILGIPGARLCCAAMMGLERGSTELRNDLEGDMGVLIRGCDTGVLNLCGDEFWYSVSLSRICIDAREIGDAPRDDISASSSRSMMYPAISVWTWVISWLYIAGCCCFKVSSLADRRSARPPQCSFICSRISSKGRPNARCSFFGHVPIHSIMFSMRPTLRR